MVSNNWLIWRRLTQLSILGLFLLGPLAGIWIIKGNLSGSLLLDMIPMTDPMLALQILMTTGAITGATLLGTVVVVVFYALLGGRLFCSWVCPINIVTDTAHWLRKRLKISKGAKIPGNLRYWVLGMVLLVSLLTGSIVWELVNPVSIFHRELIFGIGLGWTIVLGIFLFDLLFSEKGWCSHLCPMGATYALLGKFSLIRIRSEQEKCDSCGDCYYVCPEPSVITPAIKGGKVAILSSECTNCGRCIDRCPQDVFSFGMRSTAVVDLESIDVEPKVAGKA